MDKDTYEKRERMIAEWSCTGMLVMLLLAVGFFFYADHRYGIVDIFNQGVIDTGVRMVESAH